MPTFEELLKLCDGVDIMLNIELKAPRDPEIRKLYNIPMCCQIVHDQVIAYKASGKVMFSSF